MSARHNKKHKNSKPRPTPHKTHREAAPSYYECPQCGFLSDDPAMAGEEAGCPNCEVTGTMRRTFPTDRLRRLDGRIRDYHRDNEHEIVVILVTAFLEAILEDIIDRILISRGADLAVRRLVLDGERGIGGRLSRTFPRLTGDTFEGTADTLGFHDFPLEWRSMRKSRNAFIHDSPFHGPQESLDADQAERAMRLLDQAYQLFVQINNEFVADEHTLDHADPAALRERATELDGTPPAPGS